MESTPPPSNKSRSRLSNLCHYSGSPIPQLSLEIVPSSSPKISTPSPVSTISPRPPYTQSLRDILLLSPSPHKRSKSRLAERLEMADDAAAAVDANSGLRKKCKTRNTASPRSGRRSRRRLDQDNKEEREFVAGEDILVKPRKKKHGDRSRTSKSISATSLPSPKSIDGDGYNLDGIGELINDLVMWKDVSKSSLWFGFGSLCFLSSCFTKGVHFSIFSFLSQLGLLFLGVSFFSNSMRPRDANEIKQGFKLREDDILKIGRLILPAANLAIAKTGNVFSGEPAMTLKVVPFLLVGAEYGHLITIWRLCALGFFISFTGPKLYSAYSSQLFKKVENMKYRAMDAWGACTHKRIVAASAVTAFWNLTSIRTRIVAAFLCLVILRYRKQNSEATVDEDLAQGKEDKQQEEKALVAVAVVVEANTN
ncbi:hypothetical protein BUALT_Bualt03G0192000 [Buddleja alternifolia]|uniref:Reticulon-like protein n=1 Tax=Buddleja alternifolia TaxID=168488 RepID=A0AAV6Y1X0_9LAMI|nr:hypothetical protein BUALT_Bualt03G0192000 [Buddleja alternifolia]